jgi:hypothetical protein
MENGLHCTHTKRQTPKTPPTLGRVIASHRPARDPPDQQQTDREIDHPEGGGRDDVRVAPVHRELRHMRQVRDDEERGGEAW